MPPKLRINVERNRAAKKWTKVELLGRFAWHVVELSLFAWSPRPAWAFRSAVLRLFGAAIGENVHIYPSVKISLPWNLSVGDNSAIGAGVILYNLGKMEIGPSVTISQHAHLCGGTHDYRDPSFPLVKKTISVGEGAWLCADVYIGPGISIGEFAIAAARAVVVHDVPPNAIVGGNPARVIGMRD